MAYSRRKAGENRSPVLVARDFAVAAAVLCALACLLALGGLQAPSAAWAVEEDPTVCVESVSARVLAFGTAQDLRATAVEPLGGSDAAGAAGAGAAGAAGAGAAGETDFANASSDGGASAGGEVEAVQLPRFAPLALTAVCSPASIEVGRDCGMDWMCGISPCLCGSADHWGGCSCNGLEEVSPQVSYTSSDEGVVRVVEALGRTWLVPAGAGEATVTASPSLRYHAGKDASFVVRVDGLQAGDATVAGVLAATVAVIVAAVFGIRTIVRKVRK